MTNAPKVSSALAVGASTFLVFTFAVQNWANGVQTFPRALVVQSIVWGLWLCVTPLVLRWARRHPFGEQPTGKWLRLHALAAVGFAALHAVLNAFARRLAGINVNDNIVDAILANFATSVGRNVITFIMIVAAYQAVRYHLTVRERDQHAASLELDLAEARLQGLEGRLRPHFLFNTLNAIAALIREKPQAAEEMVGQLSDLLRASLRSDPSRLVRLAEEFALVEQYLAIERARFSDRLHTTVNATQAAYEALVPHLILLPLVENAIRHGLAPLERGGSVNVQADLSNARLRVTVSDDGVGIGNAPASEAGNGIGLGGVRARLAHIYGSDHRIDVDRVVPSGTRITLDIPFRLRSTATNTSTATDSSDDGSEDPVISDSELAPARTAEAPTAH